MQRLAVDGPDLPGERGAQALGPAHESLQEALRAERGEEPVEGVVAGDAVGQFQKGAQPGLLGVAEEVHVSKLSAPQSSAQMEMRRMSSNLWRRVRATRGSGS